MSPGVFWFLVTLGLAVVSGQFEAVEGLPTQGERNIVYTRYVRRRLIPYTNNVVKEVVEVFKTHRRPPPYAFLHDEDLTRFVRCDFDPSMPDCNEETYSAGTTPLSPTTSTTSSVDHVSTTPSTPSITSSWWNLRTDISRTTPITTPATTTTTEKDEDVPTTSTAKSTSVSDEYGDGDENEGGENANEYDEGKNPNETEYYDEGDKEESNNSEDATEPSTAVEEEEDADVDAESEALPQETTVEPTKKPFLNWF